MSTNSVKGFRAFILALVVGAPSVAHAQWSQWGGTNRNFRADDAKLADKWPKDGPKRLWERDLGDGYASIVVDDGRLYTMYRVDKDEFSIALDAKTGKTIWEHKNPSPTTRSMDEFGPGPHATPLTAGGRVFTIGTNAVLHAFDKKTGKVAWKHDFVKEYKGAVPDRGYSASPIAYKNTVILPVGGKGQSFVAFNQEDGRIVWKAQDYEVTHASPILIQFHGQDQLIVFGGKEVAGLDPTNGKRLWQHPHVTQFDANIATPLWCDGDRLFVSSAYNGCSRVIKLIWKDGKTETRELWSNKKMRIHHGNAVFAGGRVYASSGDFGPATLVGLDAETGEVAFKQRGFQKATCVLSGDKLIVLDQDGNLALTRIEDKGLKILSKCQPLDHVAWTVPTLVGRTLYLRDRSKIAALDVG